MAYPFRNLVFEGGGVKGIAYAGAVKVMDENEILGGITRIAGTSAGAITAALMAAGAGWQDIEEIVGGTEFNQFMDDSWGFLRDTERLLTDYGWYKGDAFSQWMKKQLFGMTGKRNLTFADVAAMSAKEPDRYRSLHVVGSNLSLQVPEVFSAETTPDVEVWYAVRISMSIPLFFAAVKEADGDVFVDGGVTWNYPLNLFDEKRYLSKKTDSKLFIKPKYPTVYGADHVYNKETLGFRLDTRDEIEAAKKGWRSPPKDISNIVDYIKALLGYMMDMANKAHLHENDWHRTVFIDTLGVRTTDFNLPPETVDALIKSGQIGMRSYLKWYDDPKSQPINRV
jgi:NTE family protein